MNSSVTVSPRVATSERMSDEVACVGETEKKKGRHPRARALRKKTRFIEKKNGNTCFIPYFFSFDNGKFKQDMLY